ncbi:MarR family transcriptional regulator [Candidatus Woesearchaeota archaeon]|nr:MarR family transcriptional regulator [Candidatus Woesearchaeota archaeon]
MKNKHVGLLIIGMGVFFLFIVFSFNMALNKIVNTSCNHGITCPMNVTLRTQELISYSLIALLVVLGVIVFFFMRDDSTPIKETAIIKETDSDNNHKMILEEKNNKLENLDEEEKKIMNLVLREEGSVYQSDLVKETGLSKVTVTRLLDRLEGRGLIERKRRGMTNIVVMK